MRTTVTILYLVASLAFVAGSHAQELAQGVSYRIRAATGPDDGSPHYVGFLDNRADAQGGSPLRLLAQGFKTDAGDAFHVLEVTRFDIPGKPGMFALEAKNYPAPPGVNVSGKTALLQSYDNGQMWVLYRDKGKEDRGYLKPTQPFDVVAREQLAAEGVELVTSFQSDWPRWEGMDDRFLRHQGSYVKLTPTTDDAANFPPSATWGLEPVGDVLMTDAQPGEEREFAGMTFVWIPPGNFTMGSPGSEAGRRSNEAQNEVTLQKGFWLGKHEVTQREYEKVMGASANTSEFKGPGLPVEQVSWDDAQAFLSKLQEDLPAGLKASLPDELRWEYACRAGTKTPYHFGQQLGTDHANIKGSSPMNMTVEVGSYAKNPWGLHDMHGNVWEWAVGADNKPILRGGGFSDSSKLARAAARIGPPPNEPDYSREFVGFRVCLNC